MFADIVIGKLSDVPVYGKFASATQDIIQTASQQYNWRRELNGNYEALNDYLNSVEQALNASCPDGSRKLNPALAESLLDVYKRQSFNTSIASSPKCRASSSVFG